MHPFLLSFSAWQAYFLFILYVVVALWCSSFWVWDLLLDSSSRVVFILFLEVHIIVVHLTISGILDSVKYNSNSSLLQDWIEVLRCNKEMPMEVGFKLCYMNPSLLRWDRYWHSQPSSRSAQLKNFCFCLCWVLSSLKDSLCCYLKFETIVLWTWTSFYLYR